MSFLKRNQVLTFKTIEPSKHQVLTFPCYGMFRNFFNYKQDLKIGHIQSPRTYDKSTLFSLIWKHFWVGSRLGKLNVNYLLCDLFSPTFRTIYMAASTVIPKFLVCENHYAERI